MPIIEFQNEAVGIDWNWKTITFDSAFSLHLLFSSSTRCVRSVVRGLRGFRGPKIEEVLCKTCPYQQSFHWLVFHYVFVPKKSDSLTGAMRWNFVSTGCSGKIVFFPKKFVFFHLSLVSIELQLVSSEYGQLIGVTVHSYCLENFEDLLQRYVGGGFVEMGKIHNFP